MAGKQAVANAGYEGGNSEVRQLRDGGCHYWEEDEAINKPTASPNSPRPDPLWLTLAEILRNLRQPTGTSGLWNPLVYHILPQEWKPEIEETWSRRAARFSQRVQANFHHLAEVQEA